MTADQVRELIKQKFGIVGNQEGNAIAFDALLKDSKQLTHVVIQIGENEQVKCISLYPWNPDLVIPGTERNFHALLERFL